MLSKISKTHKDNTGCSLICGCLSYWLECRLVVNSISEGMVKGGRIWSVLSECMHNMYANTSLNLLICSISAA
jgi:hypothetical protein